MADPFDRVVRAAARRGRGVGVCPDADVLAAYLDHGLTADERAAVEQHSADCLLCQQHLGLLGAVSLDPERPEIEAARSWLARWGWLVPVATAVLLIAVWTRIPEPPAAHAPTTTPADVRSDGASAQQVQPGLESAAREAVAPPVGSAPAPFAETQASTPAPGRERRDVAAKAAPAAAPVLPAAPPPPVAEADRAKQLADAALAPAEAESKDTAAPGAARQEARLMRKAAEPAQFAAMSPTVTYRANGGRIDRSSDGGSAWQEVFSDATLTFTASACAPGGPCWFGTSSGEILRTSDDRFVRSKLPNSAPVALITPGTGLEATVTAGPRRFRTTDGATWLPVTP